MAGLNTLKRMTARSQKRVGRGQSSGKGKTSGRGTKGQNARSGRKKRPELRDIIKKLPKRRGFGKNRARTVDNTKLAPVAVSLAKIETIFDAGTAIDPKVLAERGVVDIRRGKMRQVKIVGGELTKKFTFSKVGVSASARAAIEKAGGSIVSLDSARGK